jgi:hypothetical protein
LLSFGLLKRNIGTMLIRALLLHPPNYLYLTAAKILIALGKRRRTNMDKTSPEKRPDLTTLYFGFLPLTVALVMLVGWMLR